jgi:hypothetical protein
MIAIASIIVTIKLRVSSGAPGCLPGPKSPAMSVSFRLDPAWSPRPGAGRPKSAFQSGAEPYQRLSNIVKQARPRGFCRSVAGDQHVIATRDKMGRGGGRRRPEPPLGPVAHHGRPDLLGGCKSKAYGAAFGPPKRLNHDKRTPGPRALADGEKLGAGLETNGF